ncbi:oligopeptide/dipeptide ABC transporter ATPase [Enterobacter cloacae]|uniref:Oligopeptide/dipeptide ABC transporter ATPase n=1 Tax=Enterobacter cloacae TaxID=550 RepID=A0A377M627_ENTCL|nr:oligopeptide/dipeptide ABC transporter ATPase [Enterobacter cloacae]
MPGRVVEQGSVEAIFADPQHPYTIGLMGSIPSAGARKGPLATIPGAVPLAESMPKGCRFATRCPFAQTRCHNEKPSLAAQGADHLVACFRVRWNNTLRWERSHDHAHS